MCYKREDKVLYPSLSLEQMLEFTRKLSKSVFVKVVYDFVAKRNEKYSEIHIFQLKRNN